MLAISDAVSGNRGDRTMTYDDLNRLTQVTGNNAPSVMFGTASYGYDVLDNLTHVQVTAGAQARNQDYVYHAANRLTNVMAGGLSVIGLGYDVQGNLANRNGEAYAFDYGNRMRTGGPETYRYDVQGRRIRSSSSAGMIYSLYAQSGQLLFQQDERSAKRRQYIYLGGSLVAESDMPLVGSTATVTYQHTDALGSPVATTNSGKTVLQRSEYEPYGYLLNRPMEDGPGYTGHVTDAATGLVYMQQRYMDPLIGQRFLSVDPVTAYSPGGAFNQYWYANANPYRMVDRDGRDPQTMDDPHRPIPPPIGPFPCTNDCNPPPSPSPPPTPPPVQSPFTVSGAIDAMAQSAGLAGNALGGLETIASSEARSWSAVASKGSGIMTAGAAANAADFHGMARTFGVAGVTASIFSGTVEIAHARDSGDVGHGTFTIGLGIAAAFDVVSPPVGLAIGLTDAAVQQINYTSPISGESAGGWRAIMMMANDSERLSTPNWVGH